MQNKSHRKSERQQRPAVRKQMRKAQNKVLLEKAKADIGFVIDGEAHPNHSSHLTRLSRVRGQIDGIERMIVDRRYCPDIVTQLRAAASALKAIEAEIFKTHLRGCVKQAMTGDDFFQSEEKIQEIIKLIY